MKRLIVSLLLLAVVGTACADVTTSAIEVNGETVDRGDVMELIAALRAPGSPDNPGTVDCRVRDVAVENEVIRLILRQEVERRGGSLEAEDLEAGVFTADQLIQGGTYTEDARPFIEDAVAWDAALTRVASGEDLNAVFSQAVNEADVSLDSRFGDWVEGLGFIPLSPCLG